MRLMFVVFTCKKFPHHEINYAGVGIPSMNRILIGPSSKLLVTLEVISVTKLLVILEVISVGNLGVHLSIICEAVSELTLGVNCKQWCAFIGNGISTCPSRFSLLQW